jgi:hypothetical protein
MGSVDIYVNGVYNTQTNANGEYTVLILLPEFTGTIEPRFFQTEFTPPQRTYSLLDFNMSNQDYEGWEWRSISGYVKRADDSGINGVFMNAVDDEGNPITGEDLTTNMGGFYQFRVSLALNLTVTPELAGYSFLPAFMHYPTATVNYTEQNYTGMEDTGIPVTEFSAVPGDFCLHPNHPNPFNPETAIRYDLPEPCSVTLSVYDLMGRSIARLVDDHAEAGRHTIAWDGTNERGHPVPSGIYVLHLKAGEQTQTQKMILSR